MHWSKIDKLWNDRLGKTAEGDISWKTEQWPVPGEDPLEVRMCTRKGVPLSKYAGTKEAPRTSIVLHLTAGYGQFQGLMGSADHDSASVHFMLGRCGTPYCLVPTEFTSWHAGYWNDNSIGIEIDNIANLFKKGNNLVSCYSAGKDVYCTTEDKDVFLEKDWHGAKYWATLSEKQYVGLGRLLKALCFKHHIPRIVLPEPQRWSPFEVVKDRKTFAGILTHLNLNPKNRFDIGPYIDWPKLIQYGGLTEADCFHPPASVMDTWQDTTGGKIAQASDKPAEEKPKAKAAPGEAPPAPVMIDNHTLRIRVGKRGGRICFSVKKPGDPLATTPESKDAANAKALGKRDDFIAACKNFIGTHYKAGSKKPAEGLDGANMIGIAMRRVGLFKSDEETPADAEHLSALWHTQSGNPKEPPAEILPGDVAWFGKGDHDNEPTQHPMVYLGSGRVLGPIPDGGPNDGAVQDIAIEKVPEKFAGWMHIDDFGTDTKHTGHPGDPPASGSKLTGALLPVSPSARYDALKQVVERAGGKWDEGKGKINLVGVKSMHDRCLISPKPDDWNDTLFAAFLDEDGHKCCLDLRASLNPGTDSNKAETWQLWEGPWKFKLGEGDSVQGRALQPEGKVKGWLDVTGMGSPRPNDPAEDAEAAKVQPAAPKTDAKDAPSAPKPVVVPKQDKPPPPHDGAFVFDAVGKKLSMKFGMRMMRALIEWELREEAGELKGAVYSTNGLVKPYKPLVSGVGNAEWPDVASFMKIDPAQKVTKDGRDWDVWHAFGVVWGATGATNCCNSQMAAIFASLPDGKMRVKRDGGLLEIDVVKNEPKAPDVKDHPPEGKNAVGYAGVFGHVWIQGGTAYKSKDGKSICGNSTYSSPAWAMKWLQVGEPIAKWGNKDSLLNVRMGDDGCWYSHNWLVGDVRYEVAVSGRKMPLYVDQSDFARGEHPDPQPTNPKSGYKMTKEDCTWVELHEEEFEARLKAFLEGKKIHFEGKELDVSKITPVAVRVFSANNVAGNSVGTAAGAIFEKKPDGSWALNEDRTKRNRLGLGISRPWIEFASQVRKGEPNWGFARWYDNSGGAELKPTGGSDAKLSGNLEQGPEQTLHLEFKDAYGEPIESSYVLELPDGTFEPGQLEKGVLHKEGVPEGECKVHFPELIEARFEPDSVELKGGAAPEVELVIRHKALPAGTEATLFFEREEDEDLESADLGEVTHPLEGDAAKLAEPQETRVKWKVAGIEGLGPGDVCNVSCAVEAGGVEVAGASLEVSVPAPEQGED